MKQQFYRCSHCGNIIVFVKSSGVPVICCGEKMVELIPATIEASLEKHVPVYVYTLQRKYIRVKVGAVEHPMLPEHHIEWISIQTTQGIQRKELQPGQLPEATFALCAGEEVEAIYAYCNLHGLWKM